MKNHTFLMIGVLTIIMAGKAEAQVTDAPLYPAQQITSLVTDAAKLVHTKGKAAFDEFRVPDSRWRQGETYIFVLDPEGNMLVHPDAGLEGKNQLELTDINGKSIIRGLLAAATTFKDKPEGWYHYQWPVPGGLLPRWKSSYVQLVRAPSGEKYVVGSGNYNDRMEREFVVDMVKNAVGEIQQKGEAAFPLFYDPSGPFRAKDAYIFVLDDKGTDVANPAFPYLTGRHQIDLKDTQGKYLIREMLKTAEENGSGWVEYMWPKPGESISTQKSAFVSKATIGDRWVLVGCGVYLPDAPKAAPGGYKMSATALMTMVRDAAVIFEQLGEKAFPEFREKGSRWFRDDTYFFVFDLNGNRIFHAAEPASEGRNDRDLKDIHGRPIVEMILNAGSTFYREGWVHYMYPEPEGIFPAWKSSFVKRVTFPSGKQYMIGCGIYNMQMDKSFIEDLVNRAAILADSRGKEAFDQFRDKTGSFVFMDTYIFVLSPDGTQLVNGGIPALEGKNLIDMRDLNGRTVIRDEIEVVMAEGAAWQEFYWYKPGDNTPALKQSYIRKVDHNGEIFFVGSGFYPGEYPAAGLKEGDIRKTSWDAIEPERLTDKMTRQAIFGENATLSRFSAAAGVFVGRHFHVNEEYFSILSGSAEIRFDDREVLVRAGEVLVIPPNVPHAVLAVEDSVILDFFSPAREDWLREEDQYLRK